MAIYRISNQFLSVCVDSFGAQLMSIKDAKGTEYLWQGDEKYWKDRALTIFPYVARLNGGKYLLEGREYSMPIHGLAPYRDFRIIAEKADKITLELSYDEETLAAYPYRFSFRVDLSLKTNRLITEYTVRNNDDRIMYFGLGGHPGFKVPFSGGSFEDYYLRFHQKCSPGRIEFNENCFRSGNIIPFPLEDDSILRLSHGLFDNDAIVLKDTCRKVSIEGNETDSSITVRFPGMPYVGFWHMPKTDAPYVCIEPWCSLPAMEGGITEFEKQADLLHLQPYSTFITAWEIEIN